MEHMTTVDPTILNKRLKFLREKDVDVIILEVTSHALRQFRTLGIPIETAVFTNLTRDHLDYHGTFENYRKTKLKLFRKARYGVINSDDESAKHFEKEVGRGRYITYGINSGKLRAENIKLDMDGVKYTVDGIKIRTQIPGEFNVYNSLAAVAVGRHFDLPPETISEGIYDLESVEGRMNLINEGQDFVVIVDFAHTPDAYKKLFNSMKAEGRIIAVFGSAAHRDTGKRPTMGEIAGNGADIVILTEEDSRDEPTRKISEEIAVGARKAGKTDEKDLFFEDDRLMAMEKAFKMAKKGDVVLLLGKGHEKTMERANSADPYLEADEARKILRKMKKSTGKK
jgi:UDP-N-acetylmuramoyl-L-alanyl-D-glutamate--2,6-diaminopimelate ligase